MTDYPGQAEKIDPPVSLNNGMKGDNGAREADVPQQLLYRVPMDCGVVLYVTPVSIYARQAIVRHAEALYPAPDEDEYRVALKNIPDGVEAYEPLDQNPEYTQARLTMAIQRLSYVREALIDFGAAVDAEGGREILIERYQPRLTALAKYVPDMPTDDWTATVKFCIFTTNDDVRRFYKAASQTLETEEISAGVRAFRCDIQ